MSFDVEPWLRAAAEHNVEGPIDDRQLVESVRVLTDDERAILRLRFGDGLTFAEIGRRHSRSGSWAREHVYLAGRGLARLLDGRPYARYPLEMEPRRAALLEALRAGTVTFDDLAALGVGIRWVRDIQALQDAGHDIVSSEHGFVLRAPDGRR
jgi:hypothetical protein